MMMWSRRRGGVREEVVHDRPVIRERPVVREERVIRDEPPAY
jgi:hypothetical protein